MHQSIVCLIFIDQLNVFVVFVDPSFCLCRSLALSLSLAFSINQTIVRTSSCLCLSIQRSYRTFLFLLLINGIILCRSLSVNRTFLFSLAIKRSNDQKNLSIKRILLSTDLPLYQLIEYVCCLDRSLGLSLSIDTICIALTVTLVFVSSVFRLSFEELIVSFEWFVSVLKLHVPKWLIVNL
jgi:hypothetical protein